ncbi:isochorismatase family protein [Listeria seeligeri]|uniref:isochorismatase family protein n=1 Tax=Listeria seeligeri TaxID=1640 RepID=UPI0022EBBD82|nr:isochorismatase family protein [Listeria seeligeri]
MALLIIDTQELITNNKLYALTTFVSTVKTLLGSARQNGQEVIYVRHDDGIGQDLTKSNAGFEIYKDFEPIEGE